MVISNSDPTSFSKWLLSVRSIYSTTLQSSREFSSHSRKICSVPWNHTTKTGQILFIWQKQQNTRDRDHYRANKKHSYLQRFHPFIMKSLFSWRERPLPPLQHFTQGWHSPPHQAHTLFGSVLRYGLLQSFYCAADF